MDDNIKMFAEQMYKEWVLKKDVWTNDRKFGVPFFSRSTFVKHSIFYKEALLLLILISKSQNDARYKPLLHAYEEVILPGEQTSRGSRKLLALNSAMRDLQQLFMEPNKSITWALTWMRRNGILSYNPIDLQLFAYNVIAQVPAVRAWLRG
jgi:hypothetical protein